MDPDLHHGQHKSAGALSAAAFAGLSSAEFLALLARSDIDLQARDGRLVVNAPPGVVDGLVQAELTRRKADLLAALSRPKEASAKLLLLPGKRGDRIPLTPSQQGIWLIEHFDPGNVSYNIPEAYLLHSPIDFNILQRSVDLLLARHEILRTGFHEQDGELYQAIEPKSHSLVGSTDFTALPEAEAVVESRALIREYARRPFDLRHPPLVRFHVIRLAPPRNILFLNVHHIIADLQALVVLREELFELYQALAADVAPRLPLLSFQYADYAIWEAEHIRSSQTQRQIEYWKQKLDGLPPHLDLPLRRPYPDQRSAQGDTVSFEIPSSLRERLAQVGRDSDSTPFMAFLAAYGVLIARICGHHDFCIGSPVTRRTHVETQRMIGLFMNMVAFRVTISPQQSFRDVLTEVRTMAIEAYEHSDVPFQTLVRALRFNRRSPRSPIFQIMFAFEPAMPVNPAIIQIDTKPGTARYDLSLILTDSESGTLFGSLEYRTDLFERAEIEALGRQFIDLVTELADAPDRVCLSAPSVAVETEVPPLSPPAHGDARPTLFGRLSRALSSRSRQ